MKEIDKFKELEKEFKRSINRSELKGQSQCKMGEHKWRKNSDTELACTICPTAITVPNADQFLIEQKND